jgi:hypothetical protein
LTVSRSGLRAALLRIMRRSRRPLLRGLVTSP